MKTNTTLTVFIIAFLTIGSLVSAQTVKDEIKKLSGNFSGEWNSFKKDESGNIVRSVSWKDTINTSEPIINEVMAYVNVESKMTFDNPQIPPYNMEFKEGFYLENNEIVKHFFSLANEEIEEIKIDDNTFVYSQIIAPYEFDYLGFQNAVGGKHTVTKVILNIDETEIHMISRITTIIWKDENSELQNIQFVSMTGYHKRINGTDLQ